MMVASAVETALIALFFGEVWYFGILIFIIMALAISRMHKYAGIIVYPMIMGMEVMYFNRISETPDLVWAMISLLGLAMMLTVFMVLEHKKT